MQHPRESREAHSRNQTDWPALACLALLFIALFLILSPKIELSKWHIDPNSNTALAEALAWRKGSLALDRNYYESARFEGRDYNVVGPLFTAIAYAATFVSDWSNEYNAARNPDAYLTNPNAEVAAPSTPPEPFPWFLYISLIALPLPIFAFQSFHAILRRPAWSAVLTAALITGTSVVPALGLCQVGSIYGINHVISLIGQLIIAADLLGRRRIWPAAFGLLIAVWSRQMTIFYALPILLAAWQTRSQHTATIVSPGLGATSHSASFRLLNFLTFRLLSRPLAIALASLLLAAAVPMTLSALKFGNPLESGYRFMYAQSPGPHRPHGRDILFSPRYIPRHLVAMNLSYPSWDFRKGTLYPVTADISGGSIWLTSPLLLGILIFAPRWWRDPRRRPLVLATIPVILGIMCYRATSSEETGYYRYALDFIPIWLMTIAPYTLSRRAIPLTLAALAYSALYFRLIPVVT